MGLFKWIIILIVIYAALILYGFDDWKAGETVFSEGIDKWTDKVYTFHDKMVNFKNAYNEVSDTVADVTEGDNETDSQT